MKNGEYFESKRRRIRGTQTVNEMIAIMSNDVNDGGTYAGNLRRIANKRFKGHPIRFRDWCLDELAELENNYYTRDL